MRIALRFAAPRMRRSVCVLLIVVALAIVVVLARAPLVRLLLPLAGFAAGYGIATDDLTFDDTSVDVSGLHVSTQGVALLDVAHVHARYDWRDLVFGGAHRYGLVALEVVRPRLRLVRRPDGGFGFMHGASGAPSAQPGAATAPGAPLRFALDVRDGAIDVRDDSRTLPEARHFVVDGIAGTARIDGSGVSRYRAAGTVHTADPGVGHVRASGTSDARRGASVHRLRLDRLALRAPLNFVINTPSARVRSGEARDLDLRFYALDGSSSYHRSGTVSLVDASLSIPGVLAPLAALRGRVDLTDDAVLFHRTTARLGVLPVRIDGGLYGLAAPSFALGVAAAPAPLAGIRGLFAFSRHLPVAGTVRLGVRLAGPVGRPLVRIALRAPALSYGPYPITQAGGVVYYYDSAVALAGIRARYNGLAVTADGTIALGGAAVWDLAARVRGAADAVPYVAQAFTGGDVDAAATLRGPAGGRVLRGAVAGTGPGRLAGVFALDPHGAGPFGPVYVEHADGSSLAGAYFLDRPRDRSGFWLDARDFAFADARTVAFPGAALRVPRFSGRFDGALAGEGPPSAFRLRGRLHGRDVRVAMIRLDSVDATVAGGFGALALGDIAARGPLGRYDGSGTYDGTTLALAGRYGGSFDRLRALTGNLHASGPVAGPVALAIAPGRTVVQARGLSAIGANAYDVPLGAVAGTLAVRGRALDVLAASVGAAGSALAAAGPIAGGNGVAVSFDGADVRRLRATGLPLRRGALSGFGRADFTAGRARLDGGFSVADGSAGTLPVAGSAGVHLRGDLARFDDGEGVVDGGAGSVAGSITGLGGHRPLRYDLELAVPSAEVGRYARELLPQPYAREAGASLTAQVHVLGTSDRPIVHGDVAIPAGRFDGLAFGPAHAEVSAGRGLFVLRRGSVQVGTTALAFAGGVRGEDGGLRLSSAALTLHDFDDLFDEGDALEGQGRVLVRFRRRHGRVQTNADAELANLRVRRFDLGDASAHWQSTGARVTGRLSVGGASGRLAVAGTLDLPPRAPLDRMLAMAGVDGTADLHALDLGVWLPVVGVGYPLTGRLDARAIVRGRYPSLSVTTNASLRDGTFAKLPVTSFDLVAASSLKQTTIQRADLVVPGLVAHGSGGFALAPHGRVALAVHATSADVGPLAARLGVGIPLAGRAEADVKIDGSRDRPRVHGGFDVEAGSAGPVAIPRALGEFAVQGRDLVLSDAEIAFRKSTLYLAGSLPLTLAPFGFGPAAAPLTLELQTKNLDLSDFAPLVPQSTLAGRIDGRVRLGGTAGAPQLFGDLALTGGTIATPLETEPVRDVTARVNFAGSGATLTALRATLGGGDLTGTGSITFADLIHPSTDAAYRFAATGRRLRLDLPAYGRGTVDGSLALTHVPGHGPLLAAKMTLSEAVVPFSALYFTPAPAELGPPAPGIAGTVAPPDLDTRLALDVIAAHNVRVRSGNIDIGATGEVAVTGSQHAPILDGTFDSTGGTLTYFNTLFRVQRGTVTFEPDLGIVPVLDAHASTHVANPDPRNLSGSADIDLALTGPVTSLTIALSSEPSYSRDQILGLLFSAPAIGDNSLFSQSTDPVLAGTTVTRSNGELSVGQEAFGVLNAQFTRNLLAPFESAFSEAIGLSDLNVNVAYSGQVGFTARKLLGRRIDAIFGESFGYPEQRQTFGFEFRPSDATAAQLTVFQSIGQQLLGVQAPAALTNFASGNARITGVQPIGGTVGFSVSLQHLFP